MINFQFSLKKATQAACHIIENEGGKINYMKLIKLLYLADREALKKWEAPITGDRYFSLPHGPVVSEILDTINHQPEPNEDSYWHKFISKPANYNVKCEKKCKVDELSQREIKVLEKISKKFIKFNQWQMEKYCHKYLKEWKDPNGSCAPITVEELLKVLGKSGQVIKMIGDDIRSFQEAKKRLECH